MAETILNPHPIVYENVVHSAFVHRTQLQTTLLLTPGTEGNKWIEATPVEEAQNRRVQHFPNKDGLPHVLLEVAQIVLAESREIGIAIAMDRLVACVDHAAQMVCVLHANHIHSVDHCNLHRGEIIESTLRLQLAQCEGRSDDHITVVEV